MLGRQQIAGTQNAINEDGLMTTGLAQATHGTASNRNAMAANRRIIDSGGGRQGGGVGETPEETNRHPNQSVVNYFLGEPALSV